MKQINPEIREQLMLKYDKKTIETVEKMDSARTIQYNFSQLCDFVQEWNRITEKLKKMYGEKLADIVITPVSNYRTPEV